ncbi:MAG: hypothetical protein ACOYMM_05670, partial [Phycisphaerales bacterium]
MQHPHFGHARFSTLAAAIALAGGAHAQTTPAVRLTTIRAASTNAASTTTAAPVQGVPVQGVPAQVIIDTAVGGAVAVPPPDGAAGGALLPASPAGGTLANPFTPAEIEELRTLFASLEEPEQAEMRAYYADLGVDLDTALGLAAEKNAEAMRGQMISGAMRELDFTRKPEAVLAARAQLGFGQVAQPNPTTAQPIEVARWIHLQVMAGEWAVFAEYLRARPAGESEPVYAAILQAMNRGEIGLLPEEVLALADASPAEFKPWQLQSLGRMLQQAAAKYSTGAMLAQI